MAADEFAGLKGRIWEETWNHSRHLETMRSQYLGFFFTAVLAVTAIAAKELADTGLRKTGSLIAFSMLMLGLEVLAGFLLLAIKRIGEVLDGYRRSILLAIAESPDAAAPWATLPGPSKVEPPDPSKLDEPPTPKRNLRSTQGAAEYVLYASLFAFLGALLAGAIRSLVIGDLTSVVCWVAFVLGSIVGVVAVLRARASPEPAA